MNEKDFPILKRKINGHNLVYLDNAATTQKPNQVIDSQIDYYKNYNSNVHRGIHQLSEESSKMYHDARQTTADFINAKFNEVVFTAGTTDGINMIANSLKSQLKKGDEIILSEMEHHSNIAPWIKIAKKKKLILKYIPLKDFELDYKKAKDLISEKTKIIAISHISNVLGTINDISKIKTMIKNKNIIFILDAAQSVPHIKIDVKKLDIDFLVFSSHKMCGPTGIGVLYGKEELLDKLEPNQYGGGAVEIVNKDNFTLTESPFKFEAGTPKIAQAIGFASAIKYLNHIGMDKIEKYEHELYEYAHKKIKEIKNITLYAPKKNRSCLISFSIKNIHPHDISEILNQKGIAVRSGIIVHSH